MQLGNIINKLEKNFKAHKFSGICSDSNEINKGDIYFALKGKKKNGNNFIEDAIKKGAKTIISDNKFEGFKKNILYIYNKNPRKLLSEAASKFYKNKPNNLVAVTGTNGKSSIANFYFQILKLNNVKAASIGTLGINTPKSNFTTDNTTLDPINLNKTLTNLKTKKINNIILEASSHGLKQYRLHGNQFDIGIFTNLSRDHLDYHKTFKNYFDSKMILFNKLMKKNALIIYENNLWFSKKLQNIAKKKKLKLFQ